MAQVDFSISIVSYNVKDLLQDCLNSIKALERKTNQPSFETLVIDNLSTDGTAKMLQDEFTWAQPLFNNENKGFALAHNQNQTRSRGQILFILNPDTQLGADVLLTAQAFFAKHARAGIVGAQLRNFDQSIQKSGRHLPCFGREMLYYSGLPDRFGFFHRLLEACDFGDFDFASERQIDEVSGAAMFVRKALINEIGLFDERFFMYYEDVDLCRRARQANWQVWYAPSIQVHHHQGSSAKKTARLAEVWLRQSAVKYSQKWQPEWQTSLLKLFLH